MEREEAVKPLQSQHALYEDRYTVDCLKVNGDSTTMEQHNNSRSNSSGAVEGNDSFVNVLEPYATRKSDIGPSILKRKRSELHPDTNSISPEYKKPRTEDLDDDRRLDHHHQPDKGGLPFEPTFRCVLCNLDNIPSAFRLIVHLRKKHFACDVCLEECCDQSQLRSHVRMHKLNHLCYRCGIAYRNKSDITAHLFWKHGTESVLCKRCLHKKWPHVYHFCIPPSTFDCETCGMSFSKAVALKVHKRIHSSEDAPYLCTEDGCEKKFISRKLLLKHIERHYMPMEEMEEEQSVPEEEAITEPLAVAEACKNLMYIMDLPAPNLSESDSSEESDCEQPQPIQPTKAIPIKSSDSSDSGSTSSCGSNSSCTQERRDRLKSENANLSDNFDVVNKDKPDEKVTNDPDSVIFESDLDTGESETDEDFYDEHPQRLANQFLAEKRKQLTMQTCLTPMNSFDIPSTPPLMEEMNKEKKVKVKKRKKDRKSSKSVPSLKLNISLKMVAPKLESNVNVGDAASSDDKTLQTSQPPQPPAPPPVPVPAAIPINFQSNQIRYPIMPPAGCRPAREGESVYCYCRYPYDEVSDMIACDGSDCAIEWFHFECVNVVVPPKGAWYCPQCRPKYCK